MVEIAGAVLMMLGGGMLTVTGLAPRLRTPVREIFPTGYVPVDEDTPAEMTTLLGRLD